MKEKNKLNILCLSFWTPPITRPQSILIGKMIPEWINQGLDPAVITYDLCGEWNINTPVYKIPQFKLNKYVSRIPLARNFFEKKYYKKLYKATEGIIKKHNINIVFSFSNPQSSNILGAMLKEKLGVKFISHFSDPWFDNPYKEYSRLGGKKVLSQEKYVIKNSDKTIFVTTEARDLVMKKYPENWTKKTGIIPHCFDLKDYLEVEKEDFGKFIISYIGAFYEKRNPKMLFLALSELIKRNSHIKEKFIIKLIGAANDYAGYSEKKIKQMGEKYSLADNIDILPVVEYKESLRLMKLSDCLAVIDADIPNSPFLPSKVIDYAGSGNSIIGITPDKSPTANFLNNLGCRAFNYNQVNKLSAYLEKLILGEIKVNINKDFLKQYDASATTAKLINIFREVLDK